MRYEQSRQTLLEQYERLRNAVLPRPASEPSVINGHLPVLKPVERPLSPSTRLRTMSDVVLNRLQGLFGNQPSKSQAPNELV